MIQLSAVEARVAGVLMEKETTTPEYYPLSLNATVNACNQKSSREPVMQLEEPEVRTALYELEQLGLVRTMADTRVSKFEHRMREGLGGAALRRDEVAVICLLLLRGPQTSAELRARAERLYSFDDHQAVTVTLERLAQRDEPMVVLMARLPGAREARWMHLLCGPVEAGSFAETRSQDAGGERVGSGDGAAQMMERMEALEARVEALEEKLRRFEGV
ncbi:MAG: YceH family protein [Acidobacteriota bacterium]